MPKKLCHPTPGNYFLYSSCTGSRCTRFASLVQIVYVVIDSARRLEVLLIFYIKPWIQLQTKQADYCYSDF